MSEVPSGSWDSRYLENFAGNAGFGGDGAGETSTSTPSGDTSDTSDTNDMNDPGTPSTPSKPSTPRAPHASHASHTPGTPGAPDDADVHAWYTKGMELLDNGSPAAAAQVLQRAAAAEPHSRSVREALARAQFDMGRYAEAADNFRVIVEASPSDDYAHFGLGLALTRTGEHEKAAEYLALAAAMRPDRKPYTDALRQVRATLEARKRLAD
jgi:predicted Zn-dependent protease